MNTRTMRREVYESHETMRRSQLRKRCINRCRRAFYKKLRNFGMIAVAVIALIAVTASAIDNYQYKDLVAESKTVAKAVSNKKTSPGFYDTTEYVTSTPLTYISSSLTLYNDRQLPPLTDEDISFVNTTVENEHEEEIVEPDTIIEESKPVEAPAVEAVVEIQEEETAEEYPIKEGFPDTPDDSYYTYTEEDYNYLLMLIVGEAQNCSKKHQMYVGSVALNRLHNEKYFSYGDCMKSIALAPSQYTCFKDGNAYREPTELNKEVAQELIENGSILPANVIFQAEFKQGQGVYEQIGNTYFCYKS